MLTFMILFANCIFMPRKLSRMIGAIIMIIFGVFWMIVASSGSAPGVFFVFGLVFVAIAVFIFLKALASG
jgi:hypothetical protein